MYDPSPHGIPAAYDDLTSYVAALEEWLRSAPQELQDAVASAGTATDNRISSLRALMGRLYDEGWSRYGWPVEVGGLGGTVLHRAVMWEALARHSVPGMAAFEHLEILGPSLVALGPPEFVASVFPHFLDGSELWAQGFSESEAGSDLAALRTRAVPQGDGYLVTGQKIWTSWAGHARWCLVLARTGTTESRHRGITALAVDLRSPGVEVRSLGQADGNYELSEVFFDDAFVPSDHIIGGADGGWGVAMHILGNERGNFAWFRQGFLRQALVNHLPLASPSAVRGLGDAILDLACVGVAGYAALVASDQGERVGPRAAFAKILLTTAEQSLYDWVLSVDPDLAIDPADALSAEARQGYLFSRIVTIYGGSLQMQLDTIAKHVLQLP